MNPPDDAPERVENLDGYVDYGDLGQVVPTGHEVVRSRLVDDRIEAERRVTRTLHCCQHISAAGMGDPHARCCVSGLTICPRPQCEFVCSKCKHLACRVHHAIVNGLVFCTNCVQPQKGEFPWLILIVVFVLLFLLAQITRHS